MPARSDATGDIRIADLRTFLTVCRYGSVTSAARALEVTPSQVSKSISRLEKQLGLRLLLRTTRGVTLSDAAGRVLPRFESIVQHLQALDEPLDQPQRELSVAAPSYLLAFLLPRLATVLPEWRLRGLQQSPEAIRASITQGLFDAALGYGRDAPSEAWVSEPLGEMRLSLFGSPALAKELGPPPYRVERIRTLAFVSPIAARAGQVASGDDECPLGFRERRRGHEVETIGVGLALAACSKQVVFGPVVAALDHLRARRLVELPVRGWNVREPLFAFFNKDRVNAKVGRQLLATARAALEEVT